MRSDKSGEGKRIERRKRKGMQMQIAYQYFLCNVKRVVLSIECAEEKVLNPLPR